MSRRKNPGSVTGSLFVISGFLIGSAILRLGGGAGQVLALEMPFDAARPEVVDTPQSCKQPEDFRALMAAFDAREERIEEREKEILTRARALEVTDQEVGLLLQSLAQAEDELRALIAVAKTASEDDLTKLTSVYESMKPKEAAALFEQMDPEFAAGFLGRMSPEAAAGVMAGLSPQVAYTISVVLAGRNAHAPTE